MPFSDTYIRSFRVAGTAGLLACVVGVLVLLGWAMEWRSLTQVYLGWRPMVPITAATFVLSGLALVAATFVAPFGFGVGGVGGADRRATALLLRDGVAE
jgi:hypothetical protein